MVLFLANIAFNDESYDQLTTRYELNIGGGDTEEGSISLFPKAVVYGGSSEGFNQFRQINLYRLSQDFLNVGSSPRTTILAKASEGERLSMLAVSPENSLAVTGSISADACYGYGYVVIHFLVSGFRSKL